MKTILFGVVGCFVIVFAFGLASCGTPVSTNPATPSGTQSEAPAASSPASSGDPGGNGAAVESTPADGTGGTGNETTAGDGSTGDGTTGDGTTGGDSTTPPTKGTLTFRMIADYTTPAPTESGQGIPQGFVRPTSCQDALPFDGPPYAAGLDCDGDGGVGQYITPAVFKVALKRATLFAQDGTAVDLVPDTGTLAAAQVIDMSVPVTLGALEIPVGHYAGIGVEVYYYELVMPINYPPVNQHIRVYLSDDDFAAEGNLGHHQGDITMIDDAGQELGFVMGGSPWTPASVAPARNENSNGAGGVDAETGHARGLFGDALLWDSAPFVQGANQDVFSLRTEVSFDLTGTGTTLALVFSLADSWFYEDFNDNQTFDPCGTPGPNGKMDACSEGAGWAPLLPYPEAVIGNSAVAF